MHETEGEELHTDFFVWVGIIYMIFKLAFFLFGF